MGGGRAEARLGAMARSLGRGPTVKVGFLRGATYPDGTSVALVAAVNEYGRPSVGQPPRPFFRNMVAEKGPTWPAAVAANLKVHDYDAAASLRQVGLAVRGQLQASIVQGTYAPLKPATVKAKGFDKPLIDTSHMLNSVDYEVEE